MRWVCPRSRAESFLLLHVLMDSPAWSVSRECQITAVAPRWCGGGVVGVWPGGVVGVCDGGVEGVWRRCDGGGPRPVWRGLGVLNRKRASSRSR